MKERLTEIIKSSLIRHIDKSCRLAENIADDLLAEGVILLPCKIGKTVYDATEFFDGNDCPDIYELKDKELTIEKVGEGRFLFIYDGICVFHENIGITQFFTREEAERAVAERIENGKS